MDHYQVCSNNAPEAKIGPTWRSHKLIWLVHKVQVSDSGPLWPSCILIFFILVGNKHMHKSLDEFEFRSDSTTDYGVSCPWGSEKIISQVFFGLFNFRFIQYLQISRAGMISCVLYLAWSPFQVQSHLPLSIVKYGVSKHYAGSTGSYYCPLGYLFENRKRKMFWI